MEKRHPEKEVPLFECRCSAWASEQEIYLRYFGTKPKGHFGAKSDFSKLSMFKDYLVISLGGIPVIEKNLAYEIPYKKIDGLEKVSLGFAIRVRHHQNNVPKLIGFGGALGPFDSIFSQVKAVVQKHHLPLKLNY